jgi:tetratricopeptide (TPR) repeat protein
MVLLVMLNVYLSAAGLNDGMEKGKAFYFAAEFKRAISQFELASKTNPGDPEPYFWLGKTYGLSADIQAPLLAARQRLKARMYFAKAVELAPDSREYRRELFDFLLIDDYSPSSLQEAALMLRHTPQSDPDYPRMQSLLSQALEQRSSPESLIAAILGAPSRTVALLTKGQALPRNNSQQANVREHSVADVSNGERLPGPERESAIGEKGMVMSEILDPAFPVRTEQQ